MSEPRSVQDIIPAVLRDIDLRRQESMSSKIVAAFRDPEQKCMFVRYEGGVIDRKDLEDGDRWAWLGDHHNNPSPDPDGIVWAALTGQRSNEARIGLDDLPKRKPSFANLYDEDEPLSLTNYPGAIAKLDRIRAAARKLSIDQGGVRDNQDVAALLVEIFAP